MGKVGMPSSGTLEVIDHRNGRRYHLEISDNAIQASDLQQIRAEPMLGSASSSVSGLKVLDPGFANRAVMKSQITHV